MDEGSVIDKESNGDKSEKMGKRAKKIGKKCKEKKETQKLMPKALRPAETGRD